MEQILLLKADQYSDFSETGYYYQLTRGRKLFPVPHRHEFYELIFLLSGEILHNLDGVRSHLSSGSLLFLSPENMHQLLQQGPNTNVFSLSVSCERFGAFSHALSYSPRFGALYQLPVQPFAEEIHRLFSLSPEKSSLLPLGILFSHFLTAAAQIDLSSEDGIPPRLSDALAQFRSPKNIGSGVNGLVHLSGYSRAQLNRLVQKYYQTTPHLLLLNFQLQHALELIEHTDIPFDQIAMQVGFHSPGRFYTVIKTRYHCTPGELRRHAMDKHEYAEKF